MRDTPFAQEGRNVGFVVLAYVVGHGERMDGFVDEADGEEELGAHVGVLWGGSGVVKAHVPEVQLLA